MKASSQESRMAVRAGESLGIRPRRICGSSLGMGSDRCNNFIARSRNCSGVSIYPVSGPQSVPLQGPQNQAPSLKSIGSSQTGQFGGFSRGRARRASRSSSFSDSSATKAPLAIRRPDAQRFFRALAGRHADEFQFSVDDRGGRGADRVAIDEFLSVRAEDVHLSIAEAVLYAQPFPELLGSGAGATRRRIDQRDISHALSVLTGGGPACWRPSRAHIVTPALAVFNGERGQIYILGVIRT